MGLLLILLAVLICFVLHAICFAMCGALFGAALEEISIFVGPKLLSKKIRGIEFSLRLLPLGSFAKFETTSFQRRHPLQKAVIIASGCAFHLVLAAVILGADSATELFLNGFVQIVSGALLPLERGALLAQKAMAFAMQNDYLIVFAAVAAKSAAWNLLPVPPFNGGQILQLLLQSIFHWSDQVEGNVALLGFLIAILLNLSWIVAFATALLRG
jgi:membrane-associated protease RseP (regulator of RpoE activity)